MSNNDYNSEGENFDDIFQPKLTRADVRSEVERTLRDVATFNAQAIGGQQNAIREVSAKHPDFEARRSQMLATLEELPLLRDAINAAENNPQLSGTLPALYEITYRVAQAPANSPATAASEAKQETQRPSGLDEDAMYRGALASQRINLGPESRKAIIAELEKRGVGDIEF